MFDNLFLKVWIISYATKAGQSFIIKEVFESRIQAVDYMQGYISATERDYIRSWDVTELEIGDSDNCEHPESEREYDEKLYAMQTLECPAEYIEWYTCNLCGEVIEM